MLNKELDIRELLPQRPPMVMVDALLEADAMSAVTSFLVREELVFVDNGAMRAYALLENMAQTCAAHAGYIEKVMKASDAVRVGYIGSVKNLQVERAPRVGETLTTRVKVIADVGDMKLVSAETFVNEECIATGELKIALSEESVK